MLNGGSVAHLTPPSTDGSIAMNAEQSQAAKLLGLSAEDYQAVLDEERKAQEGF